MAAHSISVERQRAYGAARQSLLHNLTRGTMVCSTLLVADTCWLRLRGLLGRPQLHAEAGLLLLPSAGIHTFGMRHTIDVIFLDSRLQVLRVCPAVAPWRMRFAPSATRCVLELRAGEAMQAGLAMGDQLELHADNTSVAAAVARAATPAPRAGTGWLLLLLLLCVQVALCWSSREASLQGRVDLRAYYAAGTAARLHGNGTLYSDAVEQATQQALFHDGWRTLHFLYPPFAMLPYRLLAAMPYHSALLLSVVCGLLCLGGAAWLLAQEHCRSGVSPTLLAVCGLCSFATVIALMQGQLSFVLLLLLTGFYCLQRRGLHVLAGLCLALCLLKVQLALPIAALYLLWRQYRVMTGFALGAVLLLLVSLQVDGMAGLHAYAARLHGMGRVTLLDGAAAHVQYGVFTATEPNLHGLAVALLGSGRASAALTLVLSLLLLWWAVRRAPSIGTAVSAAVLLSYHLLPYDLVLLLLPLGLAALRMLQTRQNAEARTEPIPRRELALVATATLLLSAPVAAALLLCHAMVLYALAGVALVCVSHSDSSTADPPPANLQDVAPPHPFRFASCAR